MNIVPIVSPGSPKISGSKSTPGIHDPNPNTTSNNAGGTNSTKVNRLPKMDINDGVRNSTLRHNDVKLKKISSITSSILRMGIPTGIGIGAGMLTADDAAKGALVGGLAGLMAGGALEGGARLLFKPKNASQEVIEKMMARGKSLAPEGASEAAEGVLGEVPDFSNISDSELEKSIDTINNTLGDLL